MSFTNTQSGLSKANLPALFTRVRDETAETPCGTDAWSRKEGRQT